MVVNDALHLTTIVHSHKKGLTSILWSILYWQLRGIEHLERDKDCLRETEAWAERALPVDGSDSATCFRLTIPEPNHITTIRKDTTVHRRSYFHTPTRSSYRVG